MFPHTITIINIINGVFYLKTIDDVFYLDERIIAQEGLGEKFQNVHRCILSNNAIVEYVDPLEYTGSSDTFTLKENDIIVKGEVSNITSIQDLQGYNYFLIKSIAIHNDYGSEDLRNIEVTD